MHHITDMLVGKGAELIGEELARWLPSLRHIYTSAHKLSASFPGTAPEKNLAFRKHMHLRWRAAKVDTDEHIKLAREYVVDWGGVKSNSDDTLARYAAMRSRELINLGMQGISSWSKIISLHHPRQYPIYDARVAFSLNAIQALILGEIRLWFEIPATQIKTIPIEAKRLRLLCVNGSKIARRDVYKIYLAYLDEMGLSRRRQRVEMLLFATSSEFARLLSAVPTSSFNGAAMPGLLPLLRRNLKV